MIAWLLRPWRRWRVRQEMTRLEALRVLVKE